MPDSHLEMERLIDALAPTMLPSAKREAIEIYAPLFIKTGTYNGKSIEEWIKARATEAPHCFPSAAAVDLAEAAFGHSPTLKARGALLNEVGAANYAAIQKEWGANDSLRPGTRPAGVDEKSDKAPKAASSNPWLAKNWSLKKQGECFTAMGPEKCAQIAKAAGCVIGSTKPNPAFNK
jgi:hypothetical protein